MISRIHLTLTATVVIDPTDESKDLEGLEDQLAAELFFYRRNSAELWRLVDRRDIEITGEIVT